MDEDEKGMWVIAVGNAFDGVVLHGPFDDPNEAGDFAREECRNYVWDIVRVHPIKAE